jgi:hypothetical protein
MTGGEAKKMHTLFPLLGEGVHYPIDYEYVVGN